MRKKIFLDFLQYFFVLVFPSLVPEITYGAFSTWYNYPTNITGVYLAQGPNFNKNTRLFHAKVSGTPLNIQRGAMFCMDKTNYGYAILKINNTFNFTVNLWINGSLRSGVILYRTSAGSDSFETHNVGTKLTLLSGSADAHFGMSVSTTSKSTNNNLYFGYELYTDITDSSVFCAVG